MSHWYGNPMLCFHGRDTPITILERACTRQRGWVDSVVFREPTGAEERAFCYQVTLASGQWVTVRRIMSLPGGSLMTI